MALYPPIVASSMPAFDVSKDKVKIYYTLSTYNTARKDDIRSVQISVRRQSSNVNVLNTPNEIIEKPFGTQDDIDKILNRYYVEIDGKTDLKILDLKLTGFEADVLYKVQLRFSSNLTSESTNFYTSNISYYSEWSTVCIIKPVLAPTFYIDDFYTGQTPLETDMNNFYYSLADFTIIYKQLKSSLSLKYWRLRLLNSEYLRDNITNIDDFVLADSGWTLSSAKNYNLSDNSLVLSCSLPYELRDEQNYKLYLEIQTKNGYEGNFLYQFTCSLQNINPLQGSLKTYINEEEGYVKLVFSSDLNLMSNLVIRRTDARNNFLKWEDLKYLEVYENYNFTYYDFTIESGTLYRYLVQKIDARGRRGTPVYLSSRTNGSGIMLEFLHPFLLLTTGNGNIEKTKQLKLKYDFQISSYKTNVSENKTDTIGSKYPFIRRNGNMYYRSFPITGTITGFMDLASLFTNRLELFNNKYSQYKAFKGLIGLHGTQYDYTYERKFRLKVEEFLYNAKPKLYKSMQLGNIFIKLMEVSLTPKNELGRLVYNFSATAYLIDLAKILTYNNYNLISIGTFNPNLSTTETRLGQISSYNINNETGRTYFKGGLDIIGIDPTTSAKNSIAKHIKYNESFNNKIVTDFNINWLRLTIESKPYLIIELNGKYRPFDDVIPEYVLEGSDYIDKDIIRNERIESIKNNKLDNENFYLDYPDGISENINYPLYQIESTYGENNIYLGWLFYINDEQIIVSPPNNIYELKEDSFLFKRTVKIIPAKDIDMLVDFRLINVIEEDLTKLPKNIRVNKVNGQLVGKFSLSTELIGRINYKYRYRYDQNNDKIERKVSGVNTILIDTEPGTIVYLKTTPMNNFGRFVVNLTGLLNFDPNDSLVHILSLKIIGKNIEVNSKDIKEELSLDNVIKLEGKIVSVDDSIYYYYNFQWCNCDIIKQWTENLNNIISLDVHCPVDALIFYYVSVEERVY